MLARRRPVCAVKLALVSTLLWISAGLSSAAAIEITFVGDSMADGLWGAFVRMTARIDCPLPLDFNREARNGAGLARPDRLDWPAHVAELAEQTRPDIFIMSIGLNDQQAIVRPGGDRIRLNTQDWINAYADNVQAFYEGATRYGASVLIVGLPVLRDADANDHALLLNSIFESIARFTPNVEYVPPWQLAGADGYAAYGAGPRGDVVQLRAEDGVHFTTAGYDLVGQYLRPFVLRALERRGYPESISACFGL